MSKSFRETATILALAMVIAQPSTAAMRSQRAAGVAQLHCADAAIAALDLPALAQALRDAGGRDCRVATLPWGTRFECERTERLMVAGIPVRSVSVEVTDGGVRRIVAVTAAGVERLEAALAAVEPAAGVTRTIEAREDGASLVRCTAPGTADNAGFGAMAGTLPAPIEGSLGWQVCAIPAAGGTGRCIEVANEIGWRIEGLAPGSWRLRADPIGGARSVCALAAEVLADAPGPIPVLAMRPFEVRAGSTTPVGDLRISYGGACRE